ncbi:MAG: hypothetical protein WC716_09510 [Chitinophagaceae bacterium]|jgi:hypothetical protein
MVDIELLMELLYKREFDLLSFLKSGEVDVNEKLEMMDDEALHYFLSWYILPNEEYELAFIIKKIMKARASS